MKFAPGTRDSITDKPYFYGSECTNYTITLPLGEAKLYGAWHVIRNEQGKRRDAVSLGYYPSAKAAKQACEDHHVTSP